MSKETPMHKKHIVSQLTCLHIDLEKKVGHSDDWRLARHLEDAIGSNQHSSGDLDQAEALLSKYNYSLEKEIIATASEIRETLKPCPKCGAASDLALCIHPGTAYVEHKNCFMGPETTRRMEMPDSELNELAAQKWNDLSR